MLYSVHFQWNKACIVSTEKKLLYTLQNNTAVQLNNWKLLIFREDEEGEVKLENVWFSYPSRPKDLVLKVTFFLKSSTPGVVNCLDVLSV